MENNMSGNETPYQATTDTPGTDEEQNRVTLSTVKTSGPSIYFAFHSLILGVSGMLLWNSYLSSIEYFEKLFPQPRFNISVYFPIPYFAVSFLVNVFMGPISSIFSVRHRIIGGGSILAILMITFPAILYFVQNTMWGYCLFFVLIAMASFFSTVLQASAFGACIMIGQSYAGLCGNGVAIAGVLSNVLMMIFLFITSQNIYIQNFFYYSLDATIIILAVVSQIFVQKTDYIKRKFEIGELRKEDGKIVTLKLMFLIALKIKRSCIEMIMVNLVTLSIIPALAISHEISFLQNAPAWDNIFIITAFNIFDLTGRTLASFLHKYVGETFISILIYIRLLFIPWYIYISCNEHINVTWDILVIFSAALLGLTNGFSTNVIYIVSPASKNLEDSVRQQAGFIILLCLFIGLLSGTLIAIPLNDINWNTIFQ